MSNQSQFTILEAVIIMSKGEGNPVEVDISASILEFQTWEHIQKPYVDARLIFLDDFGMKDTLSVKGTERLKITFGDPQNIETPAFTKFFFFSRLNDTVKQGDRSEYISLELVEEHVYVDAVKQISRSYTGSFEDICELILGIDLGRPVIRNKFEGSAQGIRKVIVPYMSPLEAVQWLLSRATTRTGSPLYIHSTLYSNSLLMSDLDSLMKVPVRNADTPLRYSSAISSVDAQEQNKAKYYNIIQYNEQNGDDMMSMYENGNIGSYYSNIDAGTGITSGDHISVRDIIDEFYNNGLISPESSQTVYDPLLEIQGTLSDEYNSMNIFQVTSSNTYNQFQSYHDEASLLDNNDNIAESKLKVKNKIIRSILKKNVIDIGIEGALIMEAQISAGDRVRMIFLNSNTEADNGDAYDQIDKRKSGDYFILALNHKFSNDTHMVTSRLTKIGELPKDYSV